MITVTSDYVIHDGQTIKLSATTAYDYANLYPGIVYATDHLAASFTDGGAVSVSGSQGVVAGLYVHNSTDYDPVGAFLFQSTSVFQVVSGNRSATAATYGFFAPFETVSFDNEGLFRVQAANGLAVGVFAADTVYTGHGALTMRNGGDIEVVSGGDAVGVSLAPLTPTPIALTFRNTGQIHVTGTQSAIGLQIMLGDELDIFNSGALGVSVDPHATAETIGILITASGAVYSVADSYIGNSGEITADRAVVVHDTYAAAETLANSGSIHGSVSLERGRDLVINTGSIDGPVDLGSDRDILVTLAGQISGPILGGGGDDVLVGGALGETLSGGGDNDQIAGGGGNDWIDGGLGADALSGGAGLDTLSYADSTRGVVADLTKGKVKAWSTDKVQGFETLVATAYADKLTGGRVGERLEGEGGDDTLSGGAGADTLVGGWGDDRLAGGVGADTFVFSVGSGHDVVSGFEVRADRLEIHGYSGFKSISQSGADLILDLDGGETIRLLDTTAAAFTSANVVFSADPLAPDAQPAPLDELVVDRAMHLAVGERVDILVPDNPDNTQGGASEVGVKMIWGPQIPAALLNEGVIHVEGNTPGFRYDSLTGIGEYGFERVLLPAATPYPVSQQFVNAATGVIEVINHSDGNVSGVSSTAVSTAFNLGLIHVEGETTAGGIGGAGIVNRGTIEVISHDSFAVGADAVDGYYQFDGPEKEGFWNSGDIVVSGATASTGVFDGLEPWKLGLVNSGRITVTDATAALDSIGIQITQGSRTIWNSGVITADHAIAFQPQADDPVINSSLTLYNTGALNGGILLDGGSSNIRNAGVINGDVVLDRYQDVFDGRGGQVNGTVLGRGGSDLLIGGSFGDRLNAAGAVIDGADFDTLWGGGGDDTLTGGRQYDTFAFAAGDGHDVITDFGAFRQDDVIALVGMSSYLDAEQVGADTLIRLTASDDILLKNFDVADLRPKLFEFNADPLDPAKAMPRMPRAPDLPDIRATDKAPDLIDAVQGTAGNDTLDGSHGAAVMIGGAGDDTYLVDDAKDVVVEAKGEGDDTVVSTARTFRLDPEVENLVLQGGARSGVGNIGDNHVTGSAGANELEGGAGADTVAGGAGDDTLYGGDGNDVLDGGAGRDVMYGGGSYERWVFHSGDTGADVRSADVIADFVPGEFIDVSGMRPSGTPFAWLGRGGFTGHADELRYDQSGTTDTIQGDVDGDGRADFMIILNTLYNAAIDLRAHDFIL